MGLVQTRNNRIWDVLRYGPQCETGSLVNNRQHLVSKLKHVIFLLALSVFQDLYFLLQKIPYEMFWNLLRWSCCSCRVEVSAEPEASRRAPAWGFVTAPLVKQYCVCFRCVTGEQLHLFILKLSLLKLIAHCRDISSSCLNCPKLCSSDFDWAAAESHSRVHTFSHWVFFFSIHKSKQTQSVGQLSAAALQISLGLFSLLLYLSSGFSHFIY